MYLFERLTKKCKPFIFNIVLLLLLSYFIYHTIYGDRGLIAYFKLNNNLEKKQNVINQLVDERINIEHYNKLLKSGDKDFIDEKARNILGLAYEKEHVFMIHDNKLSKAKDYKKEIQNVQK